MTTRAAQIEVLTSPVIDPTTGSICSGYSVEFYAAGTSTAKNVWTEKEKTNPFTTYTLDSGGKALLYGDGVYKIVIKNTDGTAVLTLDNQKIQATTFSVVTKTGIYTATPDDDVILCNGTFTLSLQAVANFERNLTIINIGAGTITIDPASTETIDSSATLSLATGTTSELFPDTSASMWRAGFSLGTIYAPIAKGVTNGDSHDHAGGDGGQLVSSSVNFLQAGTGAVTRTAQNKMREQSSPLDFGAVGNGSTDDTSKIQAAIDAFSGKVVLFDPLVYKCASGLTVPSGTVLIGYGAELDFSGDGVTGLTLGSGCRIYGLKITGNGNGTYDADGIAISCSGTNNAPAAPTYVTGPIIRDCEINEWGNYGVYLKYVNYPEVSHNIIYDIGYAGIGGLSVNDGKFNDNYIDDITPGTSSNMYGIFIDRSEGTETADPRSYRCQICNNIITDVAAWEGIDTHGGVEFNISNNTIYNVKVGVALVGSDVSGTESLAPMRCIVDGNTVYTGATQGSGIVLSGAYDSGVQESAEGCIVSNNVIHGGGIANNIEDGGIRVLCTKSAIITGNRIYNPRVFGINLNIENLGFNVTNNVIIDPYDDDKTLPSCIAVTVADNTGYIGGNTFISDNDALGTYVAVNSIYVKNALTGLDINIGKNSFIGVAAAKLLIDLDTTTGVDISNAHTRSGIATVACVSGNPNGTESVSFGYKFPSTPKVQLTVNGDIAVGADYVLLAATSITVDGFTVACYPADAGNFAANDDISVAWYATT